MEDLIPEISKRSSKRALSDRKIPEEVVERLMTAATLAPSCSNNQSWRFLVADSDDALAKVRDALAGANYWAKRAPLIVVVATNTVLGCQLNDGRDYALFDCGLAAENLMLQGFKEGLYTHAMAGFDPLKIKSAFRIPDDYIVIALVAVGYPGDEDELNEKHKEMENGPRNRKDQGEVICYNSWDLSEPEAT